jgi:hypothetical protein
VILLLLLFQSASLFLRHRRAAPPGLSLMFTGISSTLAALDPRPDAQDTRWQYMLRARLARESDESGHRHGPACLSHTDHSLRAAIGAELAGSAVAALLAWSVSVCTSSPTERIQAMCDVFHGIAVTRSLLVRCHFDAAGLKCGFGFEWLCPLCFSEKKKKKKKKKKE